MYEDAAVGRGACEIYQTVEVWVSTRRTGVAWRCGLSVAPGVQRRNSTEYSNAACFRVGARSERALGPDLLRHGVGRSPATHSRSCPAAGPKRDRGAAAAAAAATATAFCPDAVQ